MLVMFSAGFCETKLLRAVSCEAISNNSSSKTKGCKKLSESRVKRNYGIILGLISAFASFYFSGRRSSFLIEHLKKTTTTGATAGLKGLFLFVLSQII